MKILVLYASIEGQTKKIAEYISAMAAKLGHEITLTDAERARPSVLVGAAAALLAAPVHAGRYPEPFLAFVRDHRTWLDALPNAFVSVTLGILEEDPEHRAEAAAFPQRLAEVTGWRPKHVHHAAGALRFSEYDFFKRWVMRLIARSQGHCGGEDHEFTDWAALEGFVRGFLEPL